SSSDAAAAGTASAAALDEVAPGTVASAATVPAAPGRRKAMRSPASERTGDRTGWPSPTATVSPEATETTRTAVPPPWVSVYTTRDPSPLRARPPSASPAWAAVATVVGLPAAPLVALTWSSGVAPLPSTQATREPSALKAGSPRMPCRVSALPPVSSTRVPSLDGCGPALAEAEGDGVALGLGEAEAGAGPT